MIGMIQVLTWLLGFYLVVKGIEVLQIALASPRAKRERIIGLGVVTLIACIIVAGGCILLQNEQATAVSSSMPAFGGSSAP